MTSSEIPSVPVSAVPGEFDDTARPDPARAILLDVREPDEWELGHAPGAVHIPMADVPARAEELDYDAELYVICRQGGRSIEVVRYLNHVGFEAVNVSGGMVAWQQAGRPLVADGDHPAKIY
ncbi:rhodanese-like domain-containing protein [Nocardia puris]|uniref:rhodanese-like domain-containing protein n=1 Tax=Nocardia puris TaxID=208602 RepID=UPI001895A233|nr:rhodanese-like domain-containing protein [Nocardia puris]MBF6214201.1 rhodanese-like domain-containing protein [Nocardia puris]MBF6365309.1 rhodanese-like domain-containing protein [Nocardia puris]MBF6459711.1 rhodanese-like domain-containing protein [Nocardia puris]